MQNIVLWAAMSQVGWWCIRFDGGGETCNATASLHSERTTGGEVNAKNSTNRWSCVCLCAKSLAWGGGAEYGRGQWPQHTHAPHQVMHELPRPLPPQHSFSSPAPDLLIPDPLPRMCQVGTKRTDNIHKVGTKRTVNFCTTFYLLLLESK